MHAVAALCVDGARVADLCAAGDQCVEERLATLFKTDTSVEKGFAQPTTVSLNAVCFNCSPSADDDTYVVASGDVVKICVGVHVDGYISYAGHTVAVPLSPVDPSAMDVSESESGPAVVGGRAADVMAAVRDAAVLTAALMRPGVSSDVVVRGIKHIVRYEPTMFCSHEFAYIDTHPFTLQSTDVHLSTCDRVHPPIPFMLSYSCMWSDLV